MLSCCKMGKGREAGLYLTAQKQDYYTYDEIKKNTQFYDPFDIIGDLHNQEVDSEIFQRLCAARHPITGKKLLKKADDKHVAGIDFTFSAPKSYSVIHAIASDGLKEDLSKSHLAAVQGAVDFLNEHAGYTRVRKGKEILYQKTKLASALFAHHETREGDPQEHIHCTFFNLTKDNQGKYRTIENRGLLLWRRAAAAIYHVGFADRLRKLGIKIEQESFNFACADVPPDVCELFSKRRKTIRALSREVKLFIESKNRGLTIKISDDAQEVLRRMPNIKAHQCDISKFENRAVANIFSLVSRKDKAHIPYEDYLERWKTQAARVGFTIEDIDRIVTKAEIEITDKTKQAVKAEILKDVINEITIEKAVFTENRLYELIGMKATGILSVEEVYSLIQQLHQEKKLVYIKEADNGLKEYTTIEQLKLEVGLVYSIRASKRNYYHLLHTPVMEKALDAIEQKEEITFSDEQREAINHVLCNSGAITSYEGYAGSGKSATLQVINQAYSSQGYKVLGAAFSREAAKVLQDASEIESDTLDRLLLQVRKGTKTIGRDTVIVIDEAGLIGARKAYSMLAEAIERGAKVIFTGDQKQLLPIESGQILRILCKTIGSKFIKNIIRQAIDEKDVNPKWRQDMVTYFVEGKGKKALDELENRHLIQYENSDNLAMIAMVDEWIKKRHTGEDVIMLASKNFDADRISDIVRRRFIALDKIDEKTEVELETVYGQKYFAVGDRIVTTLNREKEFGLTNGTQGIIHKIEKQKQGYKITFKSDDGDIKTFNTSQYHKKGKVPLTHGYCLTVYRGQGKTHDHALLYASTFFDRRTAYVGFSRSVYDSQLFVSRETWREQIRENLKSAEEMEDHEIDDSMILDHIGYCVSQNNKNELAIDYMKKLGFNIKKTLESALNFSVEQVTVDKQHSYNQAYYQKMEESIETLNCDIRSEKSEIEKKNLERRTKYIQMIQKDLQKHSQALKIAIDQQKIDPAIAMREIRKITENFNSNLKEER